MAWFRKKGKYWYYVCYEDGFEKQYYIGSDEKIRKEILPNLKIKDQAKLKISSSK